MREVNSNDEYTYKAVAGSFSDGSIEQTWVMQIKIEPGPENTEDGFYTGIFRYKPATLGQKAMYFTVGKMNAEGMAGVILSNDDSENEKLVMGYRIGFDYVQMVENGIAEREKRYDDIRPLIGQCVEYSPQNDFLFTPGIAAMDGFCDIERQIDQRSINNLIAAFKTEVKHYSVVRDFVNSIWKRRLASDSERLKYEEQRREEADLLHDENMRREMLMIKQLTGQNTMFPEPPQPKEPNHPLGIPDFLLAGIKKIKKIGSRK